MIHTYSADKEQIINNNLESFPIHDISSILLEDHLIKVTCCSKYPITNPTSTTLLHASLMLRYLLWGLPRPVTSQVLDLQDGWTPRLRC